MIGQNTKRDSGRKVQLENIKAAKAIADVIRTCLGPRAMLKVLLITNSSYLLAINTHSLYGYQ
jgi:chaperonin GroEL (HSP60 family)